jgi:NitT/TauT family transport system permease protein
MWLLSIVPGVVLVIAWELASGRLIRETYVSSPVAVVTRLYELFSTGAILPDLATTGIELLLGYLIGVTLGTICGYVLGRSPALARIFEPYLLAFYGVPKIAFAPLFIIWFGIGISSKVALSAIMVFFLVFYNVFVGVRSVSREFVDVARVMGADQRQLTRYVYFPATTPFIMLGLRAALPYAVIGVIVGEFTAATSGLGLYMYEGSVTFDPAAVFAGVVILLAFVLSMGSLLGLLERKLLKWQADTGKGAPSA